MTTLKPATKALLMAAAVLLPGGCAASGPYATMPQGGLTGWVVVSMTREKFLYPTMELSIHPVDKSWGGRGMASANSSPPGPR